MKLSQEYLYQQKALVMTAQYILHWEMNVSLVDIAKNIKVKTLFDENCKFPFNSNLEN